MASLVTETEDLTITNNNESEEPPAADNIRQAGYAPGVQYVEVITTFDPPFTMESVPEETRMMMGW